MIRYVQPVADIGAVPVNRQRLAFQRMDDHQRNEFFRVLIGAVIVGAVRDQRRHAIGRDKGADQVIARRLARRVRRVRAIGRGFREGGVGRAERAIDFVGRDVEKSRRVEHRRRAPAIERRLQKREGAEHVGLQKGFRIADRTVDMRLGGEMRHAGKFAFVEQALHQRRVADVALHELDTAIGNQRLQAADIGRIGHGIDHGQVVGRPRGSPRMHQVLADEARAARDQNALHRTPPVTKPQFRSFDRTWCAA